MSDQFPDRSDGVSAGPSRTAALRPLAHGEASTQESEERWNLLVENVRDHAILLIDPDGRVASWNVGVERTLGYSEAEILGQPVACIFTPEDREAGATEQELRTAAAQGRTEDERWHLRKDGTRFWASGSVTALRGPDGSLRGYIKVMRDLTEQRRAREELCRWEYVFTHAGWAVALGNPADNTLQAVNPAFAAMHGCRVEELVGRPLADTLAPECRAQLEEHIRMVNEQGDHVYESVHIRKDGSRFPVLTHVSAFKDDTGRVLFRAATFQDVSTLKATEEALRRSEARFRRLAEANIIGVLFSNAQGDILDANDAFLRIVGYSREDLRAGKLRWRDMTAPEYREADDRVLREWTTTGTAPPFEKEYIRKDGSRVPVLVGVARLGESADQAVCFVLDLTERRRMEEELRRRDRHKDEFLAMLGHELRNPLTPIRNALHVLSQRDDPGTVAWARDLMGRQVKHLCRLVDDLLDAARIAGGKVLLCRERLDLARLVRDTTHDHRPALEAAGLLVDLELPDGPVWVQGDPTRLAQALGNLLVNAGKFTDSGGWVRVRLERDLAGGRARVTVQDTGIGIDPTLLPDRVFDLYAQADHSLERSRGGLGVGLALVKGLVELHGGEVRADSPGPGQGTSITLWLPLDEQRAAVAEAGAEAARASRSLRILLVEDNRDAAESLRMILELSGHEVLVAHSGPAGVEVARRLRPGVVLCDLGLPGADGYQVAQALRQDPSTSGAFLVALSGYGQEEDRQRSREAGFDLHLTKPVDPAELEQVLSQGGTRNAG